MGREASLDVGRGGDRVGRVHEHREERIALGRDLHPGVHIERGADDLLVLGMCARKSVTQSDQQAGCSPRRR